jgi:hypothetical protein
MTTHVYDVKKQKNSANHRFIMILIIVEIILASRLVNDLSQTDLGFVSISNYISKILIIPFEIVFSTWISTAMSAQSTVDAATVISMVMYALVTFVIIIFSIILKDNDDRIIKL